MPRYREPEQCTKNHIVPDPARNGCPRQAVEHEGREEPDRPQQERRLAEVTVEEDAVKWYMSCGSGVEDDYCIAKGLPPTLESIRQIRAGEQRAGCAHFGLPPSALTFLDLEEEESGGLADRGQALLTDANRKAFTSFVEAESPDLVFLPAVPCNNF